DVYFDKPYYLAPSNNSAIEAYSLIGEGLRKKKVAALAQTVLFRRVRTVLIRPQNHGLIATTLNFDYEVRSAKDAFREIPTMKIDGEMLELAEHIIKTKMGKFEPAKFDDQYEAALAQLVKAKSEGKKIEPRKEPKRENVVDLMSALRESAGLDRKKSATNKKNSSKKTASPPRRKAS